MPPKDDDLLEFIGTKRSDGKIWTVTVRCDAELSDEEFADAIVSFANDVYSGSVTFDEVDGAIETEMQ